MITKNLRPDIVACYAIAVIVYAFAIYVGGTVEDALGSRLMLALAAASLILVTAATFRWGRFSGYPVMSDERGVNLEFLFRNLVMTVLVLVMLGILASPLWARIGSVIA